MFNPPKIQVKTHLDPQMGSSNLRLQIREQHLITGRSRMEGQMGVKARMSVRVQVIPPKLLPMPLLF